MNRVVFYTDGSCLKNPGKGGYAGLIMLESSWHIVSGSYEHTTNNCMELMSVIETLRYFRTLGFNSMIAIDIYTDSTYVMQGAMQWIKKWKLNNWKTSDKKDVANKEIWLQLDELQNQHNVTFYWVKGHSEDRHNDLVDRTARQAAETQSKPYAGILNYRI